MKKFKTPFGVTNYTPIEYKKKQEIENAVFKILETAKFSRVETGTLDYADLYSQYSSNQNLNKMFKLTDFDGSLLVLRPDATLQIGKMFASQNWQGVHKLYYSLNSFEYNQNVDGHSNRVREFSQIGIEVLNANTVAADVEAIKLAIYSLKAAGINDFIIDIGHVGFLTGLLEDAGFSLDEIETLKKFIVNKDSLATTIFLANKNIDETRKQAISNQRKVLAELMQSYGRAEVLDKVGKLVAGNKKTEVALDNLKAIYKALEKEKLASVIRIDLGLIKSGYYSGVVFKGLSLSCGSPVLEGGRYNLKNQIGVDLDAVGFCMGTQRLMQAKQNAVESGSKKFTKPKQEPITIALSKGRLADKTIEILSNCGIDCSPLLKPTRKLMVADASGNYNFIFVKPSDVPTYVERGAADMGVVGKDTLLEENKAVYEPIDLKIATCKLSVAGKKGTDVNKPNLKVATKYVNVAKEYYHAKGINVDIIKLHGSVELAPIIGLADCIVDIVESGKTLIENGLTVLEDICNCSARVIVNRSSLKTKSSVIEPLLSKIKIAVN